MKEFIVSILILFGSSNIFVACNTSENLNDPYAGKTIAITNGNLIDGTGSNPLSNATIIIKNGRIESVFSNSNSDIPPGSKIIDIQGSYILPGFINSHVHQAFDENKLKEWSVSGITTVRDVGNDQPPRNLFSQRDLLNADNYNARLVAAGPLVTTVGGYGMYSVTSTEDAENKINGLIDDGADVIKIAIEDNLQGRAWPMLSIEEIKRIVQAAHSRNKKVAAHVSRYAHLNLAIEGGVDDVDHMAINYVPQSVITSLVQHDIYWIPTLELWKRNDELWGINWYSIAKINLQRFVNAGGKVAMGTDFGGYIVPFDRGFPITELRLMKESGMTSMEVIVACTKHAAYVCDLEGELGTIEAGKIADIIIINGNPLDDLDAFLNIRMVIKNGEIIVE